MTARVLVARGSRGEVADADPAGPLSPAAESVLAAVPGWWEEVGSVAGLRGRWLDVSFAVSGPPPAAAFSAVPDLAIDARTSAETLGSAYVNALAPAVRARHGRHYTPGDLAVHLWSMTRRLLPPGYQNSGLPGLIRDRACGAGALLLPAIRDHVRAATAADAQSALEALPNGAWGGRVVVENHVNVLRPIVARPLLKPEEARADLAPARSSIQSCPIRWQRPLSQRCSTSTLSCQKQGQLTKVLPGPGPASLPVDEQPGLRTR